MLCFLVLIGVWPVRCRTTLLLCSFAELLPSSEIPASDLFWNCVLVSAQMRVSSAVKCETGSPLSASVVND